MAEILIKNMTLPTEDEQVNITILADGSVIEHFKNESGKWNSYRSGGVKAVEVPTHGDWHTGTPIEGGDYLLIIKAPKGVPHYFANQLNSKGKWRYAYRGNIIAWQKIEPYEGRIEK